MHKTVTPGAKGDKDEGLIHVRMPRRLEPVGPREAAKISVIAPPLFVYENVRPSAGSSRARRSSR